MVFRLGGIRDIIVGWAEQLSWLVGMTILTTVQQFLRNEISLIRTYNAFQCG